MTSNVWGEIFSVLSTRNLQRVCLRIWTIANYLMNYLNYFSFYLSNSRTEFLRSYLLHDCFFNKVLLKYKWKKSFCFIYCTLNTIKHTKFVQFVFLTVTSFTEEFCFSVTSVLRGGTSFCFLSPHFCNWCTTFNSFLLI